MAHTVVYANIYHVTEETLKSYQFVGGTTEPITWKISIERVRESSNCWWNNKNYTTILQNHPE